MRSISPVSSQVASIRMPGTLSGVMVMPCSAAAIALAIELAGLLGRRLDHVGRDVALHAVVVGLVT